MKFRFCGDLDCPDWVLAEISILSKMTSIKMKLLCNQVINDLVGNGIDYDKVFKLTSDAKYEPADVKACIAALIYIFSSAGKFDVEIDSLHYELQQLGLPKEHSLVLTKTYGKQKEDLQLAFRKKSLRMPQLTTIDWRVDYVLASSELGNVGIPTAQLALGIKDRETQRFEVSYEKMKLFVSELKQAHALMENLA